jgi:hypothetical protein
VVAIAYREDFREAMYYFCALRRHSPHALRLTAKANHVNPGKAATTLEDCPSLFSPSVRIRTRFYWKFVELQLFQGDFTGRLSVPVLSFCPQSYSILLEIRRTSIVSR